MIPEKQKIDEILDRFEQERLDLNIWTAQKRPQIMDMSLDDIRRKSPLDLAEASLEIRRYNFNIQRLNNRIAAWIKWCNLKLDELASEYIKDVPDNYGWTNKWQMARNNPEVCKKINTLLRQLTMEYESLRDMSKHIESIASSVDSIRYTNSRRD